MKSIKQRIEDLINLFKKEENKALNTIPRIESKPRIEKKEMTKTNVKKEKQGEKHFIAYLFLSKYKRKEMFRSFGQIKIKCLEDSEKMRDYLEKLRENDEVIAYSPSSLCPNEELLREIKWIIKNRMCKLTFLKQDDYVSLILHDPYRKHNEPNKIQEGVIRLLQKQRYTLQQISDITGMGLHLVKKYSWKYR